MDFFIVHAKALYVPNHNPMLISQSLQSIANVILGDIFYATIKSDWGRVFFSFRIGVELQIRHRY